MGVCESTPEQAPVEDAAKVAAGEALALEPQPTLLGGPAAGDGKQQPAPGSAAEAEEERPLVQFARRASQMDCSKPRLLLVSDNLPLFELLIRATKESTVVVPVQYDAWSLQELAAAVQLRAGRPCRQFASVGLLDHGAPGAFCLLKSVGDGWVDLEKIKASRDLQDYFRLLASYIEAPQDPAKFREYLSARVDLMNCSVYAGAGHELLDYLEELTQTNWAASTNDTGYGCDWILESDEGLGDVAASYFCEQELKRWKFTAQAGMAPPGMAPPGKKAGMAPPGMAPPGMSPPGMAPPGKKAGMAPPGMAPSGIANPSKAPPGKAPPAPPAPKPAKAAAAAAAKKSASSLVLTSSGLTPEILEMNRGRNWMIILDALLTTVKDKDENEAKLLAKAGIDLFDKDLDESSQQAQVYNLARTNPSLFFQVRKLEEEVQEYINQGNADVKSILKYIAKGEGRIWLVDVKRNGCITVPPGKEKKFLFCEEKESGLEFWEDLVRRLATGKVDPDAAPTKPLDILNDCDAVFACGGTPLGIDTEQEFWKELKGRIKKKKVTYFGRSAGSIWAGQWIHSRANSKDTDGKGGKKGLGLLQQVIFPHADKEDGVDQVLMDKIEGGNAHPEISREMLKLNDGQVFVDAVDDYPDAKKKRQICNGAGKVIGKVIDF